MRREPSVTGIPMFMVGALAGCIALTAATIKFNLVPGKAPPVTMTMSYAEMAATLLGAAALIVTVLGVFVAVLAIWGYANFHRIARDAAVKHIVQELGEGGSIRKRVEASVDRHMKDQLGDDGALRKQIQEALDKKIEQALTMGSLQKLFDDRMGRAIYGGAEARTAEAQDKEDYGNEDDDYGAP